MRVIDRAELPPPGTKRDGNGPLGSETRQEHLGFYGPYPIAGVRDPFGVGRILCDLDPQRLQSLLQEGPTLHLQRMQSIKHALGSLPLSGMKIASIRDGGEAADAPPQPHAHKPQTRAILVSQLVFDL